MTRGTMGRPVMDPTFLLDGAVPAAEPWQWPRRVARSVRWIVRQLLSSPIRSRRPSSAAASKGWQGRFARGVAYRLMFAPLLLGAAASAVAFRGTHPAAEAPTPGDPASFGVYFETVSFASEDGVELTGWLVPAVDARRVTLHRDRLLRHRYPAAVLVHDYGRSPQQVLPLVAPLHEEGVVVLAVGLRGTGTPRRVGQTFGLNESADVLAAVAALRGRSFVDPARITVVGVGTGANAAVLAAGRDGGIAALALIDPVHRAADVAADRLGPDRTGMRWMQPLSKWAFEIAYRHDLEDAGLDRHEALLATRRHLKIAGGTRDGRLTAGPVEQIVAFCRE